ncbi:MAG: MBL fold metallo-hydrolase [Acidobacteriaceae bacterium]
MLRMTVLASGSKGNCTVLTSTASGRSILVDAGISCRELLRRMKIAGEDPAKLSAVVVTHEHQDHIAGLGVLARKLKIPVFFTAATHDEWQRMVSPKPKRTTREQWFARLRGEELEQRVPAWQYAPELAMAAAAAAPAPEFVAAMQHVLPQMAVEEDAAANPTDLPAVEHFESGRDFAIGDIGVTPFTVPHDAADPVGFVFTIAGVRVGMVTDLGYMPPNVSTQLRRCDGLYIESNHDLEMLRGGPYPWSVKQRVLSRVGHLSNAALAEFFTREYDGSAAFIVLAHLSESNNHPELARDCAQRALGMQSDLLFRKLLLAKQAEPLDAIEL